MSHHRQEKKELKKLLAKENLVNNTKDKIFCKLGVSEISGVGVIAIRDIPEGVKVFECCNKEFSDGEKPIEINRKDLEGAEGSVLEHVNSFLVQSGPGLIPFPFKGINSINIEFYLNHSNKPNLRFALEGGMDEFVVFETNRGVREGEELTQDYNNLSRDKKELLKRFPFLHQQKVKS